VVGWLAVWFLGFFGFLSVIKSQLETTDKPITNQMLAP
jgi:hypothetical protein